MSQNAGYRVQCHLSIVICLFRILYTSAVVVDSVECTQYLCLIWVAFSYGTLTLTNGYKLHWNPSWVTGGWEVEIYWIARKAGTCYFQRQSKAPLQDGRRQKPGTVSQLKPCMLNVNISKPMQNGFIAAVINKETVAEYLLTFFNNDTKVFSKFHFSFILLVLS